MAEKEPRLELQEERPMLQEEIEHVEPELIDDEASQEIFVSTIPDLISTVRNRGGIDWLPGKRNYSTEEVEGFIISLLGDFKDGKKLNYRGKKIPVEVGKFLIDCFDNLSKLPEEDKRVAIREVEDMLGIKEDEIKGLKELTQNGFKTKGFSGDGMREDVSVESGVGAGYESGTFEEDVALLEAEGFTSVKSANLNKGDLIDIQEIDKEYGKFVMGPLHKEVEVLGVIRDPWVIKISVSGEEKEIPYGNKTLVKVISRANNKVIEQAKENQEEFDIMAGDYVWHDDILYVVSRIEREKLIIIQEAFLKDGQKKELSWDEVGSLEKLPKEQVILEYKEWEEENSKPVQSAPSKGGAYKSDWGGPDEFPKTKMPERKYGASNPWYDEEDMPKDGQDKISQDGQSGILGSREEPPVILSPASPEGPEVSAARPGDRKEEVSIPLEQLYENLENKRNAYIAANNLLVEARKNKTKRVLAEIAMEKARKDYEDARLAYFKGAHKEKLDFLRENRQGHPDFGKELEDFRAELFGEFIDEQDKLAALKVDNLEPRQRTWFRTLLESYLKMPMWQRVLIGAGLGAAAVGVGTPGVGAITLASIFGVKVARGFIGAKTGAIVGGLVRSIGSGFVENWRQKELTIIKDHFGIPLFNIETGEMRSDDELSRMLLGFNNDYERVVRETNRRHRNVTAWAIGAGILAGGVAGATVSLEANNALHGPLGDFIVKAMGVEASPQSHIMHDSQIESGHTIDNAIHRNHEYPLGYTDQGEAMFSRAQLQEMDHGAPDFNPEGEDHWDFGRMGKMDVHLSDDGKMLEVDGKSYEIFNEGGKQVIHVGVDIDHDGVADSGQVASVDIRTGIGEFEGKTGYAFDKNAIFNTNEKFDLVFRTHAMIDINGDGSTEAAFWVDENGQGHLSEGLDTKSLVIDGKPYVEWSPEELKTLHGEKLFNADIKFQSDIIAPYGAEENLVNAHSVESTNSQHSYEAPLPDEKVLLLEDKNAINALIYERGHTGFNINEYKAIADVKIDEFLEKINKSHILERLERGEISRNDAFYELRPLYDQGELPHSGGVGANAVEVDAQIRLGQFLVEQQKAGMLDPKEATETISKFIRGKGWETGW